MISIQVFKWGMDRESAIQIRQQVQIEALLKERILILGGTMGALIQQARGTTHHSVDRGQP